MILTPLDAPAALSAALASLAAHLTPRDAAVLGRIAANGADRSAGARAAADHADALRLAAAFGIEVVAGSPLQDYSWDGKRLRGDTEAYVLIHEVAHFQLAAPERRWLPDFGLGAGPETGWRSAADRAARVGGLAREREEARASLLGILWEAELGHPALASFLDQNWLEGAARPGAAAHFAAILGGLEADGFLDAALRPTRHVESAPAPAQWSSRCGAA